MNVISRPHFINETILSSQEALDTLQIDLAQYSCELTFGVASPASCCFTGWQKHSESLSLPYSLSHNVKTLGTDWYYRLNVLSTR